MSVPLLVSQRVATNGQHHLLERIHHRGPDTIRVQVVRDLHSAARSRAVAEQLSPSHGWRLLANLPADEWYDATAARTLPTTTNVLGPVAAAALQQVLGDD